MCDWDYDDRYDDQPIDYDEYEPLIIDDVVLIDGEWVHIDDDYAREYIERWEQVPEDPPDYYVYDCYDNE